MVDFINSISATEFDTGHEFVKGVLIEKNPSLDLSSGSALDGLMVENEAHLSAIHQSRLDQLANASSLAAIAANLTNVTDADVDTLVSNYGITRESATNASGPVRIIVTTPVPYQIPIGFGFTFNNLTFQTVEGFRAYPPGSVGVTVNANSKLMTTRADGKFEFTIVIQAVATGVASQLAAGSVLVIQSPLAGMDQAIVASDFVGGADAETNQQLLDRAVVGLTAHVLAGPEHIQATLAGQFPGATCAVVGVGSPLMVRDRANLFGLSTGGKQDIYCRTSQTIRQKTITVNGTVIEVATKQVLLDIPYVDGIGAYRVVAIRPIGTVGLGGDLPTSATWSTYLATHYLPFITTPLDAAFSVNGKLQVVFTDSLGVGTYALNDIRQYDIDILWMPTIQGVADFLTSDELRPASQDILVKAGVPCSVSCQATVRVPATVLPPDLATLKGEISRAISGLPVGTQSLSAFVIHRAVAATIPRGDVVNTTMRGLIYCPSGVDLTLATSSELVIPTDPANLVGPSNTFFSCTPEQVELVIVSR
jgi:hypothetical protein